MLAVISAIFNSINSDKKLFILTKKGARAPSLRPN
jgi:hypothetical protein